MSGRRRVLSALYVVLQRVLQLLGLLFQSTEFKELESGWRGLRHTRAAPPFPGIALSSPASQRTSFQRRAERLCGAPVRAVAGRGPLRHRWRGPDCARTENPPLEIHPVPEGTPLTFDIPAQAYLEAALEGCDSLRIDT